MRLLLLTAYFMPEQAGSSYLSENLFEAFASSGFEMLLYTPSPTRGVENERKRYKKKEILYSGKMEIHRFPMIKEYHSPYLRAFRYFCCFIIQLVYALLSKNIDCIYLASTPPLHGFIGCIVKKVKKIPFVYNLQDVFPESLVGTGLLRKGSFVWKISRKIEDSIYKNADTIIVISGDFKKNIMAKGVPENKIKVVYNWVDEDAVKNVPREKNVLFDRYKLDRSKFYITYNGNIGLTQNIDMLMEVSKALEANENIHFVLVGNGAYKENLEQIIKNRNITNVTLLPFQPYEEISYVFSLGDVSLVISKPGVGSFSVPSKTWSIMSASRPVLANFDENELKSIIENNHCGVFTKADDKVAFTDAILKLYKNRELCKIMGQNGRQFVMNNLTKEIGTKKYVDVIKSFEKA